MSHVTSYNTQYLSLPGNLLGSILIQRCAPVPGVHDGGLRQGLHDASRLLSGARQERAWPDRHHLPGAQQGTRQGTVSSFKRFLIWVLVLIYQVFQPIIS